MDNLISCHVVVCSKLVINQFVAKFYPLMSHMTFLNNTCKYELSYNIIGYNKLITN